MYNLLLHLAQQNPVSFHESLVDLLQENRLKMIVKLLLVLMLFFSHTILTAAQQRYAGIPVCNAQSAFH